jgi:predicted alpha/beta superfamily hydrolase
MTPPSALICCSYSVDPTVGDGGGADHYLDFLHDTVLPIVTARYRVDSADSSDRWSILGSSLGNKTDVFCLCTLNLVHPGGLVSCYAGWTRPDVWGYAGCMSSSFWWNK